ncbi:MAG TPA: addiction module protein [Planctomycetaceae bacterium]|nr:addiction module protein [Planctomycetaceae bacterium]
MTLRELEPEALQLGSEERVRLTETLPRSLDDRPEDSVAVEWSAVVARRDAEIAAGTVQTIPAAQVFATAAASIR